MARSGRNKPRTRTRSEAYKARVQAETEKALKVAGGIALFAIPGGGFIRAGMTAGKIAPRVLAKIKQLGGKRVAKPSAKQVKEAKPVSAVKVSTRPTSGPATRGGRRGRKDLKSERKVAPGASVKTGKPSALPKPKPKPDPKPAAKPKPTQATTTRTTGTPTAGVGRATLKPTPKPIRTKRTPVQAKRPALKAAPKSLKATPKVVKPKPKAAPKTKRSALTGRDVALGAAVLGGAAAIQPRTKPTESKATPRSVTRPTPKPAKPRRTPDAKKISPKGRPGATTPDTKKVSPKGRPGATTPDTKKISPRGKPGATTPDTKKISPAGKPKVITAGKNTGFGPKGNIFPKNAADRERLMKLYGGTGSAAAKAAAAGKQGTLAKKGAK